MTRVEQRMWYGAWGWPPWVRFLIGAACGGCDLWLVGSERGVGKGELNSRGFEIALTPNWSERTHTGHIATGEGGAIAKVAKT